MKHITNIEDRADQLLKQIAKSTERRDELLRDVAGLVANRDGGASDLQSFLNEIASVREDYLPQYVSKVASLANTVQSCASLADKSSRQVRRLDALLTRVKTTQTMAESMATMEKNVTAVPQALGSGDLAKTVELLRSYDEARKTLLHSTTDGCAIVGHVQVPCAPSSALVTATAATTGETTAAAAASTAQPAAANSSTFVEEAKEKTRVQLKQRIDNAMFANDKLNIMEYTKLLAQLGYAEEAGTLYCGWICEHTIEALKKMVQRELRKMSDPTAAAKSHLALVSQVLDTVAATFENEEEFTFKTFGNQGPLVLLTELHNRSTAECVPVLKDFMNKRKDVLAVLQQREESLMLSAGATSSSAMANGVRSHKAGKQGGGSAGSLLPQGVAAMTADARKADQMLEEMSHLVSCCHIYVSFAQRTLKQYQSGGGNGGPAGTAAAAAVVTGADNLWEAEDNALLGSVQEILSIYVPLQKSYFELAYEQAHQLQMDAVYGAAEAMQASIGAGVAAARQNSTGSPLPIGSPAAFMAGLSDLYVAATTMDDDVDGDDGAGRGSGSGQSNTETVNALYYNNPRVVTLPDDVFFFLRIAIHRAINTKSMQITSAVVMSASDVIQAHLIPLLVDSTAICGGRRKASFVPPGALRWTTASKQTVEYIKKLSNELRQLAGSNYDRRDCIRFNELAQDLEIIAKELDTKVTEWLRGFAQQCCEAVMPAHMERLAALSYHITEDVFYCHELNDPWVQACLVEWTAALDYMDACLDPVSNDVLLSKIASTVASGVRAALMKKKFSTYGALQADKDVRALRGFFMQRARDVPLRDAFAALSLTTSLLLSDKPSDVLGEAHNTALTAEEKRAVLLARVDFRREDVMALRL